MQTKLNLTLDPASLTLGEIGDLEQQAGCPIMTLLADLRAGRYNMREVIAVLWVLQRRDNPALTLDDVRNTKLSDVEFISE